MELLGDCDLFQREDFETTWARADPLSDQEQDLFATQPSANMDFQFGLFDNDPMLSNAMVDDEEPSFVMSRASPTPSSSSHPDVIYYSDSDEAPTVREEKKVVRPRRRQRRRRTTTTTRPAVDTSDEEDQQVIFSNGRPKLYAERPFKNPELERARLNAINAKKNRDRKKLENAGMRREMDVLRARNAMIAKSLRRYELRVERAERELKLIRTLLHSANLGSILKLVSGK
jgi:hypothetical protein